MASTSSTYVQNFASSNHGCHAATTREPSICPSVNSSPGMSATSSSSSDTGSAKVSTDQKTPVLSSKSPRVVGLSNTGGRTAVNVRSPTSNRSPSFTNRHRSNGVIHSSAIRPMENQFVTSVAFGHASSAANRLPE